MSREEKANPIFTMLHGLVLEIALCRLKIDVLEDILIKKMLCSKEDLEKNFDESKKEKLPKFFDKIEKTIKHEKVKLIFEESGDILISGLPEDK